MKKMCFVLFGLLVFAGCSKDDNNIVCGKYTIQINPTDDTQVLDIVINDDPVVLAHTVSASGARYVGNLNDTVVELWNKGRDWTLTLNDEEPIQCK